MSTLEQRAATVEILNRDEIEKRHGQSYLTWAQGRAICESHERLRMELDAARKQAGIQWRPIAECPRDTEVLLWWSHGSIDYDRCRAEMWAYGSSPTHFAIVTGPEAT